MTKTHEEIKKEIEEFINEQVEEITLDEAYIAACINLMIYHKISIKEGRAFEESFEMFFDPWDNLILFTHKNNSEKVKNFIMDEINSLTVTNPDKSKDQYIKTDE